MKDKNSIEGTGQMGKEAKLAAANFIMRNSGISKYKGFHLLIDDVDTQELERDAAFNPNHMALYNSAIDFNTPLKYDSPFYFLELIPDKKANGTTSLTATIYLLGFLNWAVYYYKKLTEEYSQKKRRKTDDDVKSSYETAKSMAILIESVTGKEYRLKDIQDAATARDSKKDFELPPKTFIILCQLFARGWYDQHFFADKHKKGTIEFAHYVSACIERNMSIYNDINSNIDSNLKALFAKDENKILDYRLYGFHILVKQEEYNSKTEKYSYSISISQSGCKHTFYRYSQLHNERHTKAIY
ncbi:hypothetical protein [Sulfurimonas sp. NW9]|uniref:hypothetical protein n=1 Tax=Sulfurimonas sp. NW9 TaxID=2922728 RepID=UPI003DA8CEA0